MNLRYEPRASTISSLTESDISIKRYGAILTMLLDGSPLKDILVALVLIIEEEKLSTKGSVLLLSDDGKRLLNGAAPHLPDDYNHAIHGIEIGDGVGSCGTAAYTGKMVIVEDIATHPFWEPFKALPLAAGLRACWSEPIKGSQGKVLGTFAMYYDTIKSPTKKDLLLISEASRLAGLAIERSRALQFERLTGNIFNHLPLGLVITDLHWSVLNANPAFYTITEMTLGLESKFDPIQFFKRSSDERLNTMLSSLASDGAWQGELIGTRVSGDSFYLELTVTMFKEVGSEELCYSWLFSDISERKRASALIDYQANYDSLTQLANRHYLCNVVQAEIESDSLTPGFGFMLMDLDNFKQVNDTLGHDKGDKLLVEVAKRIKSCTKGRALVARLGGDEFALFLPGMVKQSELVEQARTINEAIAIPYLLNQDKRVLTSISIGIARFPEDAINLEQVLNCADQAMYISKNEGRNCFHFFTLQMQQDAESTARLHNNLKLALKSNAFELHYQPIICMKNNKIIRAEVLLRWEHEGSFISPDVFIPVAESSGLIVELGHWVRQEAMASLLDFKRRGIDIGLSINISMYEFWSHSLQDCFVEDIKDIAVDLTTDNFPFEGMTLEITESLLMKQHQHLIDSLQKLRSMGIQIAIDDFGTGYSSLSYLSHFPVDHIKIDKSFIQGSESSEKQQALVKAITTLSHALDLHVIAEGVETEEEYQFVRSAGIEAVQGYYFYKPMPKKHFLKLFK